MEFFDEDLDIETKPKNKGKKAAGSNHEMSVVVYFFVGLFLLMLGYFSWFVQVKAPDTINSSYNMRQQNLAKRVIRGKIYAANGDVLAEQAMNSEQKEVRYYPYSETFAHAVGYATHGGTGVESVANISLLTSDSPINERLQKEMAGVRNYGDNIYTTYDVGLQQVAYNALGAYTGAIVVMEAKTGKILAMVSKPDFDPNTVSDNWAKVSTDKEKTPLLNRATQGLYPPGSTFKIISLLEYLRENPDSYQDYAFSCKGKITVEDVTVDCFHGAVHGKEDLKSSFAKSCNSSFANIGNQLNIKKFADTCGKLLLNKDLPIDLYYKRSSFQLDSKSGREEIMHTAIGQGETLMTPMHMALITQAIANKGMMMRSYEIEKQTNYQGTVIKSYEPKEYKRIMSEKEASIIQEYMEEVVNSGTGKKLKDAGYTVAGKTGSAEYGKVKGESHAWFTGYSNVSDPDIVVTVIVEKAGSGSDYAVPMAKRIFDAYYGM